MSQSIKIYFLLLLKFFFELIELLSTREFSGSILTFLKMNTITTGNNITSPTSGKCDTSLISPLHIIFQKMNATFLGRVRLKSLLVINRQSPCFFKA